MSTTLRQQFGTTIRDLRHARNFSQEAFAFRCGFARSYMSRIERGVANPSLDAIEVMAAALDLTVAELFLPTAPLA